MRAPQNVSPVHPAKTQVLQGERGISGDGGNRTHARFPPSSADVTSAELNALQATALALRDLYEQTRAHAATLTVDGGTLVCDEDGCHLVPLDGEPVDLTDWIDYTGMVPCSDRALEQREGDR